MMVWRIAGYVFLTLAVVCLAAFAIERNRTALGLAAVCLVLGITGLAYLADAALAPPGATARPVRVSLVSEGRLRQYVNVPGPRSAAVSACPGVTAVRPGSLPLRAVAGTDRPAVCRFAERRR